METTHNDNNNRQFERTDLGQLYGRIGISAVAAAVRYQSEPKPARQASSPAKFHEETE